MILGLAAHVAAAAEPDAQEDERTGDLRALVVAAAECARAADEIVPPNDGMSGGRDVDQRPGDGRAVGGARAANAEGVRGDRDSRAAEHRRFAAARRAAFEPAPVLSRASAMSEAISFGMIGLLSTSASAAPAPSGRRRLRLADVLRHLVSAAGGRGRDRQLSYPVRPSGRGHPRPRDGWRAAARAVVHAADLPPHERPVERQVIRGVRGPTQEVEELSPRRHPRCAPE
jgi:hypothetical protein